MEGAERQMEMQFYCEGRTGEYGHSGGHGVVEDRFRFLLPSLAFGFWGRGWGGGREGPGAQGKNETLIPVLLFCFTHPWLILPICKKEVVIVK